MKNCLSLVAFLLVLFLYCFAPSQALSCAVCDDVVCTPLTCKGSQILGPCGCCYKCAKTEGETCGGVFGIDGTCDKNLKCIPKSKNGNLSFASFFVKGICRPKSQNDDSNTISDQETNSLV